MDTLRTLFNLFVEPAAHFFLAAFAGVLAFYAMLTISYTLRAVLVWRGVSANYTALVMRGMGIVTLLLAISCALLSHVGLDLLRTWYYTPLGPPLTIIR